MTVGTRFIIGLAPCLLAALIIAQHGHASPAFWSSEWPKTNFDKHNVDLDEIRSGGPPKNGIPPIYAPQFKPASDIDLAAQEPVITVTIGEETKAYPLRVLMWHEIANDTLGGVPIAVTYCPLCNSTIVFDRRVDGEALAFGTTGKLRNSDLVMWDDKTESWWQQAMGEAIVGDMTGTMLDMIPSRLESWKAFRERMPPDTPVLVPTNESIRAYGKNPYAGYDSGRPFLYDGELPEGVEPLERVVTTADRNEAYTLPHIREVGEVTMADGTILTWTPGQASAVDSRRIADGRDVGTISARRNGEDVVYFVEFAFAFHAFSNGAPIHRR